MKRRYRQMVKVFHPDARPGGRDPAPFLEIQEAYAALADPVRRAAYDARHDGRGRGGGLAVAAEPPAGPATEAAQAWPGPETGTGRAGGGIWGAVYPGRGADGHPGRAGAIHPGWDERYPSPGWPDHPAVAGRAVRTALTLEQAYLGADLDFGGFRVRIPPGARDGMILRVPPGASAASGWLGRSDRSGPPGVIQIALLPDSRFRVVGDDLLVELAVPRTTLERGGKIRLRSPGGWLAVEIPGGLGPGRTLRLRGRGLPATPRRRAGDMLVKLVSAG